MYSLGWKNEIIPLNDHPNCSSILHENIFTTRDIFSLPLSLSLEEEEIYCHRNNLLDPMKYIYIINNEINIGKKGRRNTRERIN